MEFRYESVPVRTLFIVKDRFALGLNQVSKKSGGQYQKDDRISVFRISKEGNERIRNALEILLDQS